MSGVTIFISEQWVKKTIHGIITDSKCHGFHLIIKWKVFIFKACNLLE